MAPEEGGRRSGHLIGSVRYVPICMIPNTQCLTSHFDTESIVLYIWVGLFACIYAFPYA